MGNITRQLMQMIKITREAWKWGQDLKCGYPRYDEKQLRVRLKTCPYWIASQKLGDGAQTNLHDDDLSQSKGITSIERTATASASGKEFQPKRMVFQIKTDN